MVPFTAFLVASLMALPPAAPRVLRTFPVGGEGRWDYVNLDPEAGRLLVSRSTRVMVLDLDGKVVGEIPDTQGVHGVAFSRELDRGWTSNGQAGTVTVFKLSTLAVETVVRPPAATRTPSCTNPPPAGCSPATAPGRTPR